MNTLHRATLGLAAAVLSMGCGEIEDPGMDPDPGEPAAASKTSALTTTANQSLVITMTSVTRDSARTEDPCSTTSGDENKVWTMGHLLKREAEKNGIAPATYVSNWMNA